MRTTNRTRQEQESVYVVGYARLPEGTTAKHVYSILGLGMELEKESGKVLEVSCTTLPSHGSEFLRKILVGKSLEKDFDSITREIRSRYIDRTRGAVLAALEDLLKRFNESKKKNARRKTAWLPGWEMAMSKKILVVEDHADSREILVIQLQEMSYKEVVEAANGEEGIEKALVEGPDLIIMDLGLPGINGIEVTARLKDHPKTAHIPVIALTAWQEQDYKDKALQAGMAAFLPKPTPARILKDAIERSLQGNA